MNSNVASAFVKVAPHLLLENAFGADMAARLLAFAISHENHFTDSEIVAEGGVVNKSIRSSRRIRNFGELRDPLEAHFRAALPAAMSVLGIGDFALSGLSLELAAHGDGDFYHRHIDTFVGHDRAKTDRVLTGVYYFYASPKSFTGGELRLFSILAPEQGGSYEDIEPKNDSLLLFPSWMPHEVRPVCCPGADFSKSRFAINCWYNRKIPQT